MGTVVAMFGIIDVGLKGFGYLDPAKIISILVIIGLVFGVFGTFFYSFIVKKTKRYDWVSRISKIFLIFSNLQPFYRIFASISTFFIRILRNLASLTPLCHIWAQLLVDSTLFYRICLSNCLSSGPGINNRVYNSNLPYFCFRLRSHIGGCNQRRARSNNNYLFCFGKPHFSRFFVDDLHKTRSEERQIRGGSAEERGSR